MTDSLRPLGRPRLYEQVAERLRAHIAESGLDIGDKLPPERMLADQLGVSRASVKQAIVMLEVQGQVEVRHGGGTYLRRLHAEPEPVDELVARKRRLPEVLEAREAVEGKLAELAAQRHTESDLAELDAALAEMRQQVESGQLGQEGDRRFHAAVTQAAHNTLLAEFMRSIADEIAESRAESLRQPQRPNKSLAQHERIAEAIKSGQPRAAATAMRRHLRTVSRVRLLRWEPDDQQRS